MGSLTNGNSRHTRKNGGKENLSLSMISGQSPFVRVFHSYDDRLQPPTIQQYDCIDYLRLVCKAYNPPFDHHFKNPKWSATLWSFTRLLRSLVRHCLLTPQDFVPYFLLSRGTPCKSCKLSTWNPICFIYKWESLTGNVMEVLALGELIYRSLSPFGFVQK